MGRGWASGACGMRWGEDGCHNEGMDEEGGGVAAGAAKGGHEGA